MLVLINGPFGVGKTTAARALARRLPGSILFDPELVGLALQTLAKWLPIKGRGTGDFQDMPVWRRLSVMGICVAALIRPIVIVPMSFSNPAYLSEFRQAGLRQTEVRHICLTAPLEVVIERLDRRQTEDPGFCGTDWAKGRAAECCIAQTGAEFEVHVPTTGRTPEQVVDRILELIGSPEVAPQHQKA